MDASLQKKWESVASRYDELTTQLMDPSVINQPSLLVKMSKERTEIEAVAQLFDWYLPRRGPASHRYGRRRR